jgi:hypothetical protein
MLGDGCVLGGGGVVAWAERASSTVFGCVVGAGVPRRLRVLVVGGQVAFLVCELPRP